MTALSMSHYVIVLILLNQVSKTDEAMTIETNPASFNYKDLTNAYLKSSLMMNMINMDTMEEEFFIHIP
jgi:hypothetical protein